ncbi:MAG: tetratricopeptide repeat protein [Chitinispirillaceae bacterium]|nr:tetratricopeptide repeat protein [Chitinispirillaceae bacterium]
MNNHSEELKILKEKFEAEPQNSMTALSLGQYYSNMGWFNEAIDIYKKASEYDPSNAALLLEYGNILYKKGEIKEASEIFKKLTEIHPERIEGWNNLGITLIELNDLIGASKAFVEVLKLEPENPGALLNMGNIHFLQEKYTDSLAYFQKVCELRPDSTDAWYNKGNTLIKLGKYDEAIEALKKAIRYKREFPSALKNLGWIYEHCGNLEEAKKYYEEAIELTKGDARLYVNLGNVLVKLNLYEEAKNCFLKAVRLAPQDVYGWIGLRNYAIAKGDIPTFVRAVMAILGRLTGDEIAESIEILYELDQEEKAYEILKHADRLGKEGICLDAQRIYLYQKEKNLQQKAEELVIKLIGIENPTELILRGLARFFFIKGQYKTALEYIDKMVVPSKSICRIKWRAMIELGEKETVKKILREYLNENKMDYDVYFLLAKIEGYKGNIKRAKVLLVNALDNGFHNIEEIKKDKILNKMFEDINAKRLIE